MKLVTLPIVLGIALVAAECPYHQWKAPEPSDFRGPCPMLNTLANHGFLPRDGRNITKETTVNALASALHFNTSLGTLMFEMAIVANPEPNATFFTLDQLNVHNVLEHDASLSRSDAFFGNNHIFNETIFEETKTYWTGPVLDANMLANGKIARQVNSKAFNPNYTFTTTMEQFSLGEVSAPIVAFGDLQAATVNRNLVEYFFENERFPAELGWSIRNATVSLDDITRLTQTISNATSLITTGEPVVSTRRRDLHAGLNL
ncbi:Cloroperoxidase [Hypoxylon trugodes]|uniref:Cloroperoxidase n=1 Tax=Hypoxylon trugodes TaxID=326681 RepID=UPI00219A03A0|nr:Cloroperoxidase [Hypoxylon trugodes]KAI1385833.1 Cloroperoxidase [Hypoxylon trugodes]